MSNIKIGVICPSEIAYRRFMPALAKCDGIEFGGVAIASSDEWFGVYSDSVKVSEHERAQKFVDDYGGQLFSSYLDLINSENIDAVYLPLPPGLHYKWGKEVLSHGKHLFIEKPSTLFVEDSYGLVSMAENNGLAVHENYMFQFHSQIDYIVKCIKSGEIGDIRFMRAAFGFPMRKIGDFRYNPDLGGGALFDCGGYPVKLAGLLFGDSMKVLFANMCHIDGFDVDMYGSIFMKNDANVSAQLSYGMDNSYKCELELWGSRGCLSTDRIFTAPVDYNPVVRIRYSDNTEKSVALEADDSFKKSIDYFVTCVNDKEIRKSSHRSILSQAAKIEHIKAF